MDAKTRTIVDTIKKELIKGGKIGRTLNKQIPIKGVRHTLPLSDCEIDIAYYRAKSSDRPLIIGLHGGGFINGGSAMDDNMWTALCEALDFNIASVDYRMAPDHKWPTAMLDTYETAVYLQEHAADFKFKKDEIMILGCSAGANLAATTCIYAKQKGKDLFKKQILIYPCTDFTKDPFETVGTGAFSPLGLIAMNELYIDPENCAKSTASPVCATLEELQNLPPAIFCFAGEDILRPEGQQYADMLKKAGVSVCKKTFAGMPHAYFENGYAEHIPDMLMDEVTQKCVADGSMKAACEETLTFIQEHICE